MRYHVSVMTMIPTRSGFAWWPCEVDLEDGLNEGEVMDEITDALAEDGVLRVTKLDVEPGPQNDQKIVTKRTPSVLGRSMIGTITPVHFKLVG